MSSIFYKCLKFSKLSPISLLNFNLQSSKLRIISALLHKTQIKYDKSLIITNNTQENNHNGRYHRLPSQLLIPCGVLSFFAAKEPAGEETPEDKLIMTIKRSVLCIQRQQYNKAEQMLHLALKMAQDLQHRDGVTFVYDVMANLAMETQQFKKAEDLFVSVMQRLLQDGYKQDDIKILHISSKIAHMSTLKGQYVKAEQGFKWVLENVDKQLQEKKDDPDLLELFGLTKDCFGQLLVILQRNTEAKQYFLDAFKIYIQIHGRDNEEVIQILNNLSVVCTNLNELIEAEEHINEALELAKKFPELYESGVYHANKGMVYFKRGLLEEAQKLCSLAWRKANKAKNDDGIAQSDYCLKELKKVLNKS